MELWRRSASEGSIRPATLSVGSHGMFLGEYTTSITTGNRIAIPKKFRERLQGEGIVLTRGYEGCIVLIGKNDFEKLLTGVSDIPFISADKRETSRFLLAGAHEVGPDRQGRVVVPDSLIKHARLNLKGEVTFLGIGTWVEVWDKKQWEKYQKKLDSQSTEIANRLSQLDKSTS